MAEEPKRISTKAAGVVGIAVMCSRLLGLIRELIIAALFGVSNFTDAFYQAFRIPNLLRDLFAEGALSTAFITVFSKKIKNEGDESAWALANKVATLTVIFMSAITLLGIWISPWLVHLITPGFEAIPGKIALTIHLTRIMFPFILLVSLAALVMGMLNAKNVFGMPALASAFFNLGSIIGGLALAKWLDPHFGTKDYGAASVVGFSIGTLIGGFLQLVVQFPALHRVGFRFRPDLLWRDEGVRKILLLMAPAVIAASAVQVNVAVNGYFASYLGEGAVSWLTNAFRLMQLPLGIFGVAVGTVTLPLVSRFAATHDFINIRATLAKGIRLACLLTVPSALGLFFYSQPIISLIFQHGKFHFSDVEQAAAALRFYAVGLAAYSSIKVLAPAFYAIDKRNLPMIVSFISIAVNYGLNQLLTFHYRLGISGLALSTGLVAIINFTILYVMMTRYIDGLETRKFFVTLGKIAIAGALLALVCIGSQHWFLANLATMRFLPKAAISLITIAVAATLFFGTAYALKIEEVHDVAQMIKKRLGSRR